MGDLPTVAPRLVFHAVDVRELLAGLVDEHAALQDELQSLEAELAALTRDLPGSHVDEVVEREAASSLEAVYGQHRDAALAALDAQVEAGELAAAERVAAAERDAAHRLALVHAEVGDRLVGEAEPATRVAPAPAEAVEMVPEAAAAPPEVRATADPPAPSNPRREAAMWNDEDTDSDRFRAFWSEQDEVVTVREAILAPLVAVAPMVFALLAIVLLLIIVI